MPPSSSSSSSSTLLLRLLLLTTLKVVNSVEFSVGFTRWPEWEVVGVPGSPVHLPCATNITADKISWQYNHHFLLASTPPDDSSQAATPSLLAPFHVTEVEGGSELVVNLAQKEAQYKHQLGLYQCVAWFGAIALTSLPGRLRAALLKPFPEEDEVGVEVEVEEWRAARVECGLPSSVPDADLTFYKDGRPIDLDTNTAYRLTPHGDLVIVGVGTWADGVYSCSAYNRVLGRTVRRLGNTTVKVIPRGQHSASQPPSFVTLRTVYTATTGANVTLLCLATGHPEPRIRWSKYGGVLPSSSVQLAEGSLSIVGVAVEDEGTYLCHAENGVGAAESILDVALEVLDPPQLVEGPSSASVEEGSRAALICRAQGHPPPKIMWVFNGRLVRNDGNILITEDGLTIATVQKEHAGIFQCFVHNQQGTVQQLAMISVVPRTVTVSPNATHHHNPESEPADSRRRNGGQQVEGGGAAGVTERRKPGGNGRGGRRGGGMAGRRRKVNREGEEKISLSDGGGKKNRKKKGRMVPPSKPRLAKVSDESIMVTWEGSEDGSLPIMFYKIQYKMLGKRGNRRSQWMTVDEDIPPHIHSFEVTGLQTGRTYRFRMAAVYTNHDNKPGPTSRRFLLEASQHLQRPISPPTITSLVPLGPTTVSLAWQYQPPPGVSIEGFFINYREAAMATDYTKVTVLQPEMRSFVINHLIANVSYDFKIRVFNLAGASDFSPVYKLIVAGSTSSSTTQGPGVNGTEVEVDNSDDLTTAVVKTGGGGEASVSNLQLYIILGAALGLLLLIVVVSAAVYSCRHTHADDDTRSTKYEDTSLHIHRETSTYSLPPEDLHHHNSNGRRHNNGYLPHQTITVTPQDSDKVAMESSLIDNNNLDIQRVERCYTSPARRIAAEDGCELKTAALLRNTHDNLGVGGREAVTRT
ncbi:hypothetical protein Pcinc_039621 [Petrolisthes cinctipes]|uniref:Interference hedgehog n=1 Tax=Petrolisthes cinctipes TaxID=88211 RepID=A0AAE1EIZ4_PETCI|nr:hypothetical protein Pcinc_039621 [Petrolisthes cinctipes]